MRNLNRQFRCLKRESVARRVIFMDFGEIIEQNTPDEFFNHPRNDRTKLFLSQILAH